MGYAETYAKLDAAITQAIADRSRTFSDMGAEVWQEAHAIRHSRGAERTLDTRLQALRKRQLIHFANGAWHSGSKV